LDKGCTDDCEAFCVDEGKVAGNVEGESESEPDGDLDVAADTVKRALDIPGRDP
jgi:hypothetical protein